MNEIIIKDSPGFQLRIKKWECLNPKGLFAIHFVQAVKDKDGKIESESIYEFFMNEDEMIKAAGALAQ